MRADACMREKCNPSAGPTFLELVDLDLFNSSRQWLKPPFPSKASASAAREADETARAAARAKRQVETTSLAAAHGPAPSLKGDPAG